MPNTLMAGRRAQDWVNLVLAVCLFLSPWVIGFVAEPTPTWNAWIVGIVLGALAIATLSAFAEWEEWANMVIGLWLIVSPWLLGFMANVNAMWTHVILGVLVAAISAWAVWDYRHHSPA
ncbi:hypothetical protein M728_004745 (plasmid) [Ensifer sp. WSM1721]|jgi:hypothetical protein|uniref:SPW repeat protein n=1 Tax=Ensifer sp. WSM1721 TaxID=1041159 RepID=UPI00047B3BF7|nr:SPW repeat protein [Ensifer sp. WSM1721]